MDKPTAKAITERIGRIRKDVKSRIGGIPCPLPKTPVKTKTNGQGKTPGSRSGGAKKTASTAGSNKKRKAAEESDDEGPSYARIPAREAQDLQTSSASLFKQSASPFNSSTDIFHNTTAVKPGLLNTAFEGMTESRPKRAASASIKPYIKQEEWLDGDNEEKPGVEYEDSGTEYGEPEDRLGLFAA
jgi:hypothetical protein